MLLGKTSRGKGGFLRLCILGVLALSGACLTPSWAQAPTNLFASSATNTRVTLNWTGTAASYTVQRRVLGGTYGTIATVGGTTYTDTQIDAYTNYQYEVLASGTPSNELTIGPPPAGFSDAAPVQGLFPPNYGRNISVVLDSNGDPAIAFVAFGGTGFGSDPANSQLMFRSWNRASFSWNPVVAVATIGDAASGGRQTISLAYDSTRNVYMIASESNHGAAIQLFTSSDGGVNWNLNGAFSSASGGFWGPSLALSNGTVFLAYEQDQVGIIYYTASVGTNPIGWTPMIAPKLLGTTVALSQTSPSLALDSAGSPAIAYWVSDTTQNSNSILLYWRPNGGSPVKVTDSQNIPTSAAVRLRFFGTQPRMAINVFRSDSNLRDSMHFVRSEDGGNTWSAPILIPPDGSSSSTDYPADFVLDSQGHGAISFGQSTNVGGVCGNPKLSRSTDLNVWSTCAAGTLNTTSIYDSFPNSIAMIFGGNDKLFLFFQEQFNNGTGNGVLMYREPPGGASTTPSISTGGVVDAAAGQGSVVAGSLVSISGANFSDVTLRWDALIDASGNLPTTLGTVQVKMNGILCPIYFLSSTLIGVQAPAGVNGIVPVQVMRNGLGSNIVNVTAVQHAPQFFTFTADSQTFFPAGVFWPDNHLAGDPATLGANFRKAKSGDIIQLFATGLTSSTAGKLITSPVGYPDPIIVRIGSIPVTPMYTGLVAAGEFQINIIVPPLADGNYAISIETDNSFSKAVLLPITH